MGTGIIKETPGGFGTCPSGYTPSFNKYDGLNRKVCPDFPVPGGVVFIEHTL